MVLRVIDIETTGTDPASDQIIEIASVDLTRDGIGQKMERRIKPTIPIPPEASAIHHLLDADVADARPAEEVIPLFAGADWYVAHNAEFDSAFLKPWLGENWVCTYKCALRVWPDFPKHSNQALRYRLGLASPFGIDRKSLDPHRALDDCIVTAVILHEILKVAKWPDMVRWSSEPPLLTRMNFGKHFGKRWDEVETDYLHWILDKMTDNPIALFNAAYWLDARKGRS